MGKKFEPDSLETG